MFKYLKLLTLLCVITVSASAQNYSTPGVPPGSTNFSPTFRRLTGITDSLNNFYLGDGNKYYKVYTAPQSGLLLNAKLDSITNKPLIYKINGKADSVRLYGIVLPGYVPNSRQILNGYGIMGGHSLATDITLALDTASITNFLKNSKNLFDVPNKTTARLNLGITPIINSLSDSLLNKANRNFNNVAKGAIPLSKVDSIPDIRNTLGRIINDNFNRATTGFPLTGSNISQSIVGGKWQISNSTGNSTYDNYSYINYTTWLDNFDYTIPITPTVNGNGLAIGWVNTAGSGHGVKLDMNAAGNRGTLTLISIASGTGTVIATSATNAFTYTNGDTFFLRIRRVGYRLIGQVFKAGQQPITVTYNASLSSSDPAIGRDNRLVVFSLGGTQQISNINSTSFNKASPMVATVGDSNSYGFNSGAGFNYNLTFHSQINNYIPGSGVLYAASGATLSDFKNNIKEFIKLKPRYAVIHLGTNDAIAGVSSAVFQSNYNYILPILDSAGIIPIICTVIPTSNSTYNSFITQYNTFINTLTGKYRVIDTYTALVSGGVLNTAYDSGDGVHINTLGHAAFKSTVVSALPILNITTPSIFKAYTGASSFLDEPALQIQNHSTVQGNGTTTFNRSIWGLNAGAGTVNGRIAIEYDSGGYGNSMQVGTTSNHALIFTQNNAEKGRFDAATGYFGINTSSPVSQLEVSGDGLGVISNTIYAAATSAAGIATRKARGTASSPSAVQTDDVIGAIISKGYHSSNAFGSNVGGLFFKAAENFTNSAQGAYATIATTPIGSTTRSEVFFIDPSGNVGVGIAPTTKLDVFGDGSLAVVRNTVYSSNAADAAGIVGRKARGSQAAPTAVQTDDILSALLGSGYQSSGAFGPNVGRISIHAAENFTNIAQGSYVSIATTPTGSTTRSEVARFSSSGLNLPGITAGRAVVTDVSKNIVSSSVTSTELGYLSGVTSAIQTQLNAKGSGTVTSVSGTTNRITSTGGATPVIDISSTYEALFPKLASSNVYTAVNTYNGGLVSLSTINLNTNFSSSIAPLRWNDSGTGFRVDLLPVATLTANRDIRLQDGNGTLAFLSDVALKSNLSGGNTFSGNQTINGLLAVNKNLDGYTLPFNTVASGRTLIGNNKSAAKGEGNFINEIGVGIGGFEWGQISSGGTYSKLAEIDGSTGNLITQSRVAVGVLDNSIAIDNDFVQIDKTDNKTLVRRTKAQVQSDLGVLSNPMTTSGDIIYGGASGTPTRLGAGSNGQVLTLSGGVPTWVSSSGRSQLDITSNFTLFLNADYINTSATQYTVSLPSCNGFTADGGKIVTILCTGSGGIKISVPSGYAMQSGTSFATTTGTGGATLTQGQKVQLIPTGTNTYYLQPLNGTVTLY